MYGVRQRSFDVRKKTQDDESLKRSTRGFVERALSSDETLEIDGALSMGFTRARIMHPYIAPNSWIRVIPERGTGVLTQPRGDSSDLSVVSYESTTAEDRIRQYKEGRGLYRDMDEGEIELMSAGRAYLHLSKGGDVELRGGVIRQELLQTRLELNSVSPVYIRSLHRAAPDDLRFQERFGVVKRPDDAYPNALQRYIKDQSGEFQYEYCRFLGNKDDKYLTILQEGVVIDRDGEEVKHGVTDKSLIYRRRFLQIDSDEALTTEIDKDLNILIACSADSAKETNVTLGDENELKLSCKDTKFNIAKTGTEQYGTSLSVKSPTISYDASTLFTVKTARVHLNSSLVHCGSNPVLPVVLAPPLLTSLTTMLGAIQGALTIMGADPVFITACPVAAAAAQTAATALGGAIGSLQNIPSTQVFASG